MEISMNGDFVSIRGLSLPRRTVLQGMASLFSCAVTPSAFADPPTLLARADEVIE
jgi:hypothetical protein